MLSQEDKENCNLEDKERCKQENKDNYKREDRNKDKHRQEEKDRFNLEKKLKSRGKAMTTVDYLREGYRKYRNIWKANMI